MSRASTIDAYLRRPELARLLAGARARREHLGRVGGRVTLAGATADERRAVADLLGLPAGDMAGQAFGIVDP